MTDKTKTGLEILQAAVLLGILGDVLLRQTPWGLNVLLFVAALVAAFVMMILRRKREFWNTQTIALNVALVFFAAMFTWRDSIELQIFDGLAILAILAILSLQTLKIKTQIAGVFHYFVGFVWSGISITTAPLVLLFGDINWKSIPQTGWSKHLTAILRGVLIAAPLLLIFGALFVAADAVFQGIVEETFNINAETIVGHIFFVGFFSWIAAGYLRGSLIDVASSEEKSADLSIADVEPPQNLSVTDIKDEDDAKVVTEAPKDEKKKWSWQNIDSAMLPKMFTLGTIEVSVILGLVNLLFLSFIIVQIPYLFGGFELVQNTPDFKLAEYARRGFGELVTVSALVLPILLVSHWLLRKDSLVSETIFRVFAGIQIALLFLIMISATQRLLLLTGNLGYGLTTIRFYPMAIMILLALIFTWFSLTILRGYREQFAWGALWLTFLILGGLHAFNPDNFIVSTNVRLMQEGREFDASYNSKLSDDAIPVLIEALPFMDFKNACVIKYKLYNRQFKSAESGDFRSFNYSRWLAEDATDFDRLKLNVSECPSRFKD